MAWDAEGIRSQFPILQKTVDTLDGSRRPLVYLDHGASTHAPRPVLDAYTIFLERYYANIHRGHHTLSLQSSQLFDDVHNEMAAFVGAKIGPQYMLLSQNTTQALDMAAHLMADTPGKTAVSMMEHHSNDLPHRRAGEVEHFGLTADGRIDLDDLQRVLDGGGVKLVAVTGAANVTGVLPPVAKMARMAHDAGARILIDAAQLVAHARVNVREPDHPEHIDFLATGSHKAYAPFGSGFLLAPAEICDAAPPYMPGGGTVTWVTDAEARFTDGADRHQGGTPNIAGAIGYAAALRWLADIGIDNIRAHEQELASYGTKRFADLEGVTLLGPQDDADRLAVFPFNVGDLDHAVASSVLNFEHGIATRNGCFCAHPYLHRLLGLGDTTEYTAPLDAGQKVDLPGAVRASCGIYNTRQDLDILFAALEDLAAGRIQGEYDVQNGEYCKPVDFTFPAAELAQVGAPITVTVGTDRA